MKDEYTPTEDDLTRGYKTPFPEDDGIRVELNEAEVRRGITQLKAESRSLGHIDAQIQMQASIDASIREVQANAWDEGRASAGVMLPTKPPQQPTNPYRRDEA